MVTVNPTPTIATPWLQPVESFRREDNRGINRIWWRWLIDKFEAIEEAIGPIVTATEGQDLLPEDSGNVFTNEIAIALAVFTLPLPSAGLRYSFIVMDNNGIRVIPDPLSTIRILGTVTTPTTGFIQDFTVGDTIEIIAVNNTQWFALTMLGTWTVV